MAACCSLVVKQRCPFAVFTDDGPFLSNASVLSKDLWSSNDEGTNKQYTCNDKGKDPLEGDDVNLELSDGDGWTICEYTTCSA